MMSRLSDKYAFLLSDVKNTPPDQWKSKVIKNRILTYEIPNAKPTASIPASAPASANLTITRGRKRKRGSDKNKDKDGKPIYRHCHRPGYTEDKCYFLHPELQPE